MTAPAPEKAAPIPAEVRKLELWFFRDLTEEQRMKLFALFGAPVAEIRSQSDEQLVFRHIMKALPADRASQEERITRADLASLLEEVRRPSASLENHLRQIGERIERLMEVAGEHEERIREDRERLSRAVISVTQRAERAEAEFDRALYLLHHADFSLVGLPHPNDGMRQCIGTKLEKLAAAKRLRDAGLALIEDSPSGPVVQWAHGRGYALPKAPRE